MTSLETNLAAAEVEPLPRAIQLPADVGRDRVDDPLCPPVCEDQSLAAQDGEVPRSQRLREPERLAQLGHRSRSPEESAHDRKPGVIGERPEQRRAAR